MPSVNTWSKVTASTEAKGERLKQPTKLRTKDICYHRIKNLGKLG